MLEIALMIEGQNGLTWPHWQRIVCLAEDLGFMGLFRSDHFTNPTRPISTRWNYGRRLPDDFAQLITA